MNDPIKFGTDGWRAIVARDFTFRNLERVARATAAWLGNTGSVVLGYDARFMGQQFAEHVARILTGEGIRVLMADSVTPTPAISWATLEYGADAGVVITASHNSAEYNGYKVKAPFGGPATPAMVAAIEREIKPWQKMRSRPVGNIERVDICSQYLRMLRKKVDVHTLGQAGLRVAHDTMYGAGRGLLTALLGKKCIQELHADFNPSFVGLSPEPVERNMRDLSRMVAEQGLDIGLANDGDADRIGVVDETGTVVTAHMILALLLRYMFEEQGLRGIVVKTFATTHLLEKMAGVYNLPVETYPIGFKYIAPRFVDGDALVGGEESGGIAVAGHIPERDGIYVALLLIAMMHRYGKKISTMVDELCDDFGPHAYYRADIRTSRSQTDRVIEQLKHSGGLDRIGGLTVQAMDTLDGYKHLLPNTAWLLVRPSGTEPVLRIYAEAESDTLARILVQSASMQLGLDE